MIIDLEKPNSGTWFAMDGGGQVCLRICAGDDYAAIRAQAVKVKSEVVWDPKTRQAQKIREEITDDRLLSALLWDFCIVAWQEIFDAHEQPIPCTKDMKLLLMGKCPSFFAFVSEGLDQLRGVEAQAAEAAEKN
jgi:hypothetical protein